jgi:hypothetical protein
MPDNVAQLIAAIHGVLTAPVGVLPASYDTPVLVLPWGA